MIFVVKGNSFILISKPPEESLEEGIEQTMGGMSM